MGQKIHWLVEGRVLHHTIYGEENPASLNIGASQCRYLLDQSDAGEVYIVVNVSKLQDYPQDVTELTGALSPLYFSPQLTAILYCGEAAEHFCRIATLCGVDCAVYATEAEAIDSLPANLFSRPA